eukprot:gene6318-4548_t
MNDLGSYAQNTRPPPPIYIYIYIYIYMKRQQHKGQMRHTTLVKKLRSITNQAQSVIKVKERKCADASSYFIFLRECLGHQKQGSHLFEHYYVKSDADAESRTPLSNLIFAAAPDLHCRPLYPFFVIAPSLSRTSHRPPLTAMDKYIIDEKLGEGAIGEVFRVTRIADKGDCVNDIDTVFPLMKEGHNHPNVVKYIEYFKDGEFSREAAKAEGKETPHTFKGQRLYRAPEVWRHRHYTSKSDIWSCGCILYELVTRHRAFSAPSRGDMERNIVKGVYQNIRRHVSDDLKDLIASMLNVKPALRPSCTDVLGRIPAHIIKEMKVFITKTAMDNNQDSSVVEYEEICEAEQAARPARPVRPARLEDVMQEPEAVVEFQAAPSPEAPYTPRKPEEMPAEQHYRQYDFQQHISDGIFGEVYRAVRRDDDELFLARRLNIADAARKGIDNRYVSVDWISLLTSLLSVEPAKRPSAEQILSLPVLQPPSDRSASFYSFLWREIINSRFHDASIDPVGCRPLAFTVGTPSTLRYATNRRCTFLSRVLGHLIVWTDGRTSFILVQIPNEGERGKRIAVNFYLKRMSILQHSIINCRTSAYKPGLLFLFIYFILFLLCFLGGCFLVPFHLFIFIYKHISYLCSSILQFISLSVLQDPLFWVETEWSKKPTTTTPPPRHRCSTPLPSGSLDGYSRGLNFAYFILAGDRIFIECIYCTGQRARRSLVAAVFKSLSNWLPLQAHFYKKRLMAPKKQRRTDSGHTAPAGAPSSFVETGGAPPAGLQSIFMCSGPKVRLLHPRTAVHELRDAAHSSSANEEYLELVCQAWEQVLVPSDWYWRTAAARTSWERLAAHHKSLQEQLQHAQPGPASLHFDAALFRPPHPSSSGSGLSTGTASLLPARRPNPLFLPESFYPTRTAAINGCGYLRQSGRLVIAADKLKPASSQQQQQQQQQLGLGQKMFSVMSRGGLEPTDPERLSPVAHFTASIPVPPQRNLYVLIDEAAPVDPFVDVDLALSSDSVGASSPSAFQPYRRAAERAGHGPAATVGLAAELLLEDVATYLQSRFEALLQAPVSQLLVLTSSYGLVAAGPLEAPVGKLSFHLHFRMADGVVLRTVKDLDALMRSIKAELQKDLAQDRQPLSAPSPPAGGSEAHLCIPPPSPQDLARALLACIDFSVYTRWRAFRLPYSVKAPAPAPQESESEVDRVLRACGLRLPPCSVGSAAPAAVTALRLPPPGEAGGGALRRVIESSVYRFRFLLPLIPGRTTLQLPSLAALLRRLSPLDDPEQTPVQAAFAVLQQREAHARWQSVAPGQEGEIRPPLTPSQVNRVFDLAFIQREPPPEPSAGAWRPVAFPPPSAVVDATPAGLASPFRVPRRPFQSAVVVPIAEAAVKRVIAEVFYCLHPAYEGVYTHTGSDVFGAPPPPGYQRIQPERLQVQFDKGQIRGYYVMQKMNKYCLKQRRCHRSTYGQLYLTYGSIKVRCYSNDCHESCVMIPWKAPTPPAPGPESAAGSPSASEDRAPAPPAAVASVPSYPMFGRLRELHQLLFPELPAEDLLQRYGDLRDHPMLTDAHRGHIRYGVRPIRPAVLPPAQYDVLLLSNFLPMAHERSFFRCDTGRENVRFCTLCHALEALDLLPFLGWMPRLPVGLSTQKQTNYNKTTIRIEFLLAPAQSKAELCDGRNILEHCSLSPSSPFVFFFKLFSLFFSVIVTASSLF